MSAQVRRSLLRTGLIAFVVLDLLGLASFVFNQWFAVQFWHAWGLAALLALPLTMLVLPLVEAVLDAASQGRSVPLTGENIPGAGQ